MYYLCVLFNRPRVHAELKEKEKLLEDANSELEALKCTPLTVNYVSKSETETVLGDKTSKINKVKADVSDFKTS